MGFLALILFCTVIFLWKDNTKLNKQIILLYGDINNIKIEKNILENRLELLEELEIV